MIEGFKLKVPASELKSHCESRAAHHAKRADDKETSLPHLKTSFDAIKGTSPSGQQSITSNSYHLEDPVKQLEADIRDHRNKSSVFTFFSEHLFDDDYTLTESDLQRLEILKR